jgi:hypothetical protein
MSLEHESEQMLIDGLIQMTDHEQVDKLSVLLWAVILTMYRCAHYTTGVKASSSVAGFRHCMYSH